MRATVPGLRPTATARFACLQECLHLCMAGEIWGLGSQGLLPDARCAARPVSPNIGGLNTIVYL